MIRLKEETSPVSGEDAKRKGQLTADFTDPLLFSSSA